MVSPFHNLTNKAFYYLSPILVLLINSLGLCQVKEKETKMGNIIGRSEIRSGPSGLKLESQRIVDFNGRVEDWQ